ncbi:cysteine proteinase [Saccharata proteae CBS 121410]|uniref:ubiquitinyl hydrolase 1 n=1 Tax=Saccharata proteae CBS 121410 TaxID=1314787 RepID=A0A9P4LZJ5_9PEZI|nr:cysteine proteinase [Saccharata proteae CBS 121410]
MEGMSRFLSRRGKRSTGDKHGVSKPRKVSSDLYNIFSSKESKKADKEEENKVKTLSQRLQAYGITAITETQIQYALRSKLTNGDLKESMDLLLLFEDSLEGILKDYNPSTKLLGAENRESVTCYLDALLFAMFARLDSFEAMLFDSFADEPRKRLATLLRLWVNLLRSGKLITTDITKHLQEALSKCGWQEAAELVQQDASEAFTFITGQLELPLLTLKMDIYHGGKEDVADDHRFVNERLLEVAIPESDPNSDHVITLEECLQTYFDNLIEVKRHLQRRQTLQSTNSTEKSAMLHIEAVEAASGTESPNAPPYSIPTTDPASSCRPINMTIRTDSIFSKRHIEPPDEEGESSEPKPSDDATGQRPRAASLVKREITMPAFQFFSLIPWYTDNAPTSDAQVAAHFSLKRPILGICLKRYSMTPNGTPQRRSTHIDIPLEIALPHFISDDQLDESGPLFGNFKLILQSVVCHRGVSINSGHYVSLVRGQEPTAGSSHSSSTVQDELNSDEPQTPWMRFDDLARERVSYVDINQALTEECPYLLFYQVVPIDEDLARGAPPSYEEANSECTNADDFLTSEKGELAIDTDWSQSQRPSLDLPDSNTPILSPSQEDLRGRSSFNSDRRSIAFSDLPVATGHVRASTGPSTPVDEQKTGFLSSRRGSKVSGGNTNTKKSGSKSRPTSQSGDNRLSITMQRLTGRKSRDRLEDMSPDNEVAVEDNPNPSTPVVLIEAPANVKTGTFSRGRAGRRDKRKSKTEPLPGTTARKKVPDRECMLM